MKKLAKELSKAPAKDSLMELEEKGEDSIGWSVYYDYMKASGSLLTAPLVIFLCCLAQASQVMATFWLGYWTNGTYNLSTGIYIGGYIAFGVVQTSLTFVFSMVLTIGGTNSSKKLLSTAMQSTLKAPM
ncbi:ABC transporter family protein [Phlyctema vagabunda]|uniref:ABC transporter family protein n=1 Tax=Phlyctema vagabunda TaxID=108571 RepID=A0ABR4PAS0_9HELO